MYESCYSKTLVSSERMKTSLVNSENKVIYLIDTIKLVQRPKIFYWKLGGDNNKKRKVFVK